VSDWCLMPSGQLFSYIMARTSYMKWKDDDVCFVLDQHASASSLKQNNARILAWIPLFYVEV
jgi:hypothetical protein